MNTNLYKIYANSNIKKNTIPCARTHNTYFPASSEKSI